MSGDDTGFTATLRYKLPQNFHPTFPGSKPTSGYIVDEPLSLTRRNPTGLVDTTELTPAVRVDFGSTESGGRSKSTCIFRNGFLSWGKTATDLARVTLQTWDDEEFDPEEFSQEDPIALHRDASAKAEHWRAAAYEVVKEQTPSTGWYVESQDLSELAIQQLYARRRLLLNKQYQMTSPWTGYRPTVTATVIPGVNMLVKNHEHEGWDHVTCCSYPSNNEELKDLLRKIYANESPAWYIENYKNNQSGDFLSAMDTAGKLQQLFRILPGVPPPVGRGWTNVREIEIPCVCIEM